jgi:hypothetical protein
VRFVILFSCGIQPTRLGTKEAEMKIVGCDLHARQQTIAVMDMETGEVTEKTLSHEGICRTVKAPRRG